MGNLYYCINKFREYENLLLNVFIEPIDSKKSLSSRSSQSFNSMPLQEEGKDIINIDNPEYKSFEGKKIEPCDDNQSPNNMPLQVEDGDIEKIDNLESKIGYKKINDIELEFLHSSLHDLILARNNIKQCKTTSDYYYKYNDSNLSILKTGMICISNEIVTEFCEQLIDLQYKNFYFKKFPIRSIELRQLFTDRSSVLKLGFNDLSKYLYKENTKVKEYNAKM